MPQHLVIGAGPVGRAVARRLLDRGDDVILATRSGSGPGVATAADGAPGPRTTDVDRPGRLTLHAADASSEQAMVELARGTDAI